MDTILVVDDEKKIAEVIQSYLQKEGFAVACAYTGSEALTLFEKQSPALVVLDLMLPDISGEEVCRTLRKKSRVPIIMLTARAEEESILNGLEIGADDYIVKPFSPRQVVARVRAILRRSAADAITDEFSFNGGELVVDNLRHEVRREGGKVALTPNEFKLLMTMAKHPTRTFTRDELIRFALGDEFAGYDRAVDTHIKNIRQKIEPDAKTPRYILTVHGVGYKFGGEAR